MKATQQNHNVNHFQVANSETCDYLAGSTDYPTEMLARGARQNDVALKALVLRVARSLTHPTRTHG